MANVGDDVLRNILARLPGKPLLRFRCVSKHWNHLISDPYLMKTRSRRMILLPFPQPLALIDDNVPAEDEAHSMVRIGSPLDHQEEDREVSVVGTLNGIVLLALTDFSPRCHCQLILYNPLTCASKILEVMDTPVHFIPFVFGFGYGYGDHDLKIVKFYPSIYTTTPQVYKCDIFDLKTSSWSTSPRYIKLEFSFWGNAGTFLNGFLYWTVSDFLILALNLKDMEFSKIKLPRTVEMKVLLLGSVDGCLCLVNKIGDVNFDMWLMKEKCSWLKAHSFRFGGLEGNVSFYPICVLGNGKIVMTNTDIQLVIYDTLKHSYKTLNGLATLDDLKIINWIFNFKDISCRSYFKNISSIEYVESLVSPCDDMWFM